MSAYSFRNKLEAALLEEIVGTARKVSLEMRGETLETSGAEIVPYRLVNELDLGLFAPARFSKTFC